MKIKILHDANRTKFIEDADKVLEGWREAGSPDNKEAHRLLELRDIFHIAKDGDEVVLSDYDIVLIRSAKKAADTANGGFPMKVPGPPGSMGKKLREIFLGLSKSEKVDEEKRDILIHMADQVVLPEMTLRHVGDMGLLGAILKIAKGE